MIAQTGQGQSERKNASILSLAFAAIFLLLACLQPRMLEAAPAGDAFRGTRPAVAAPAAAEADPALLPAASHAGSSIAISSLKYSKTSTVEIAQAATDPPAAPQPARTPQGRTGPVTLPAAPPSPGVQAPTASPV